MMTNLMEYIQCSSCSKVVAKADNFVWLEEEKNTQIICSTCDLIYNR